MNQDEQELTKSQEWLRDQLHAYLGYGGAAFTVMVGWLLSNDSLISLTEDLRDRREAAIALAVFIPILWIVWYVVIQRVHAMCPKHSTILAKRHLHLYAISLAVALGALWCVVADVF